jgi:hypothetical protein
MGSAKTRAAMAKESSSPKFLALTKQRTTTPIVAKPPEIPVTIGVMCVMSLAGTLHIVCVLFWAPILVSRVQTIGESRTHSTLQSKYMMTIRSLVLYSKEPACHIYS